MSYAEVCLREWDDLLPEKGSPLFQRFLDDPVSAALARELNDRGVVGLTELRQGLRITANSHVGSIRLGDLQLKVRPKITGMPLYRLLKYAYDLRDLKLLGRASHDLETSSFQDLLIHHLCAEGEELLRRGLNRDYLRLKGDLQFPRGRIDLNRLAAQAGVSGGTLPCTYFSRTEDNRLNQVLLAGLRLALPLTSDTRLKAKLRQLCLILKEYVRPVELTEPLLLQVDRGLNRLQEHYRPALKLIRILYESQGLSFSSRTASLPFDGFFFDMNAFFQALLSRLLREHLEGFRIREEYKLHESFAYAAGFNPRGRLTPKPRPDFAVLQGGQVVMLLDAKYRDLWEHSLPSSWLYQMTVYAASGVGTGTAKVLYPSMSGSAKLQVIEVRNPVTGGRCAQVVLQPVHLLRLATLLDQGLSGGQARTEYLRELVFGMGSANWSGPC